MQFLIFFQIMWSVISVNTNHTVYLTNELFGLTYDTYTFCILEIMELHL